MLKVKKKNITVLHCTGTHTRTMMVSQLALSSEAQIAFLCQGELLKAKQKHSLWVLTYSFSFDKMEWQDIYYLNYNKKNNHK